MNSQKYIEISGLIFIVAAILHLIRAAAGWSLVINGYAVPVGVSWVVVVVIGFLAYQSLDLREDKSYPKTTKAVTTRKKTTRKKTTRKTTTRKSTKK